MTVTLASPHDDVWLSIRGSQNGAVLTSILSETARGAGSLPATQDYLINAVAAGGDTEYVLQIEMAGARRPDSHAGAYGHPGSGGGSASKGVIYLTFDDGPIGPALDAPGPGGAGALRCPGDLLCARPTGRAVSGPRRRRSEGRAHSVANHTYEHQTTGQDRPGGLPQGGQEHRGDPGGPRAPSASALPTAPPTPTPEPTRLSWATHSSCGTSTPSDWSRPGASAIADTVLKEAFPGAIVLFHDGGGDRAQTVEALGSVLEGLSQKGYVFEPVCR